MKAVRWSPDGAVVEGVDVYGASSLSRVVHFLRGDIALEPVRSLNGWSDTGSVEQELVLGEFKGQQHVKRAVEVAAARRAQYKSEHKAGRKAKNETELTAQ
jgi:magnesium chelatase family protein